jgi:hypothetical protein
MTKLALCFALSLLVLGHVGPVLAAQMPEEFRGRWCGGAPTRPFHLRLRIGVFVFSHLQSGLITEKKKKKNRAGMTYSR